MHLLLMTFDGAFLSSCCATPHLKDLPLSQLNNLQPLVLHRPDHPGARSPIWSLYRPGMVHATSALKDQTADETYRGMSEPGMCADKRGNKIKAALHFALELRHIYRFLKHTFLTHQPFSLGQSETAHQK